MAGVGILAFAPTLFVAALPLLFLAICPLSMLVMMGGMGKMMGMGSKGAAGGEQAAAAGPYGCPMHPAVRSEQPGRCPECGMNLVPAAARPEAMSTIGVDAAPATREEQVARLRAQMDSLAEQQAALAQQIEHLDADSAAASTQPDPVNEVRVGR